MARTYASTQSKLHLKAAGLYTVDNQLSGVPDGALLIAKNVNINNDDIVEPRPGFKIFGDSLGPLSTSRAKSFLEYRNRIYRHYLQTPNLGYMDFQTTRTSSTFERLFRLKMNFSTSLTALSNVATFVSQKQHGLVLGDLVEIDNAIPSSYNGIFTVTSVPNGLTFTYGLLSTPVAATGDPVLYRATMNDLFEVALDYRLKKVEANSNLYVASSTGVLKIDNFNSTVSLSGISEALNIEAELANEPGFFNQDTQVGYRVLWGIKDSNENLILGAASSRAIIANSGLTLFISDFNATQTTLDTEAALSGIYPLVATTASFSVVKAQFSATLVTLSGETITSPASYTALNTTLTAATTLLDMQSVYDDMISLLSADAALNGTYVDSRRTQQADVTITVPQNITPSHFYQIYRTSLSIGLDVSPNEDYQLIYESNATYSQIKQRVLIVRDITPNAFRGVSLYQNENQEGGAQANNQAPFARDIALYNDMVFLANTKTKHFTEISLTGLDFIVNASSTLTVTQGANSFVINIGAAENISTGTAKKFTAGTTAQNIEDTARSIVRVINRYVSNIIIDAFYTSIPTDPPGKFVLRARDVNTVAFTTIAANSTGTILGNVVSAYSPSLITATQSENEEKTNGVYFSKSREPEALPTLNFLPIGGGRNVIHRIITLRDNLYIYSDEGIFKINGDSPSSLTRTSVDRTVVLKAPDSLVLGDNQIFGFTNTGVSVLSETENKTISRRLDNIFLKLLDPSFTGFVNKTFAVFYESNNKYMLHTVKNKADTVATIVYVYDTSTDSWTTHDRVQTAAMVKVSDDKLYYGANDVNFIEEERKAFDFTDYCDREYTRSITSNNKSITSIAIGNPSLITVQNHGLESGNVINITGSNSTPVINGEHSVTVVTANNLLINVTVTTAGTSGLIDVITGNDEYCITLNNLNNVKVGDAIVQEIEETVDAVTYTYANEASIIFIEPITNLIKISNKTVFEVASTFIFSSYETELLWVPIHAGDPSINKHFREIHLMFDNFRGNDMDITFFSDVESTNEPVKFTQLQSVSDWGTFEWGDAPWGGSATVKNIRTYVPRGKQRARLLYTGFTQQTAREYWKYEGTAIFYRILSEKTNKNQ